MYCGGEGGQIYAVTLAGDVTEVANTGGSVLGMAVDGNGLVYACDWHRGEVVRVEPATGVVETYTKGAPELPLDDPNSPVFTDDGVLFVTGSENPAIFRVEPGGATSVWTTAIGGYPNGVTLTPAGDAVVVAQSHPEGFDGGRVWRVPIQDDGSAGTPVVMAELFHTVPDGVAYDTDGACYVAHNTPDRIDRILPDGVVETVVDDWEAVCIWTPDEHRVLRARARARGGRVRRRGIPRDRRPRRPRVPRCAARSSERGSRACVRSWGWWWTRPA